MKLTKCIVAASMLLGVACASESEEDVNVVESTTSTTDPGPTLEECVDRLSEHEEDLLRLAEFSDYSDIEGHIETTREVIAESRITVDECRQYSPESADDAEDGLDDLERSTDELEELL